LIVNASFFRFKAIPKAVFNKSTGEWKSDPNNIPASSHFCVALPATSTISDQVRQQAKLTISQTGAPAAKVMRQATVTAIEEFGSREDIDEGTSKHYSLIFQYFSSFPRNC